MSDALIRQVSEVQVETIEDLHHPAFGPRQVDRACPVCRQYAPQCSGHEGHMELPVPVFRAHQLPPLAKVLSSVCLGCARLRLRRRPPEEPDEDDAKAQKEAEARTGVYLLSQRLLDEVAALQPRDRLEVLYEYSSSSQLKQLSCDFCGTVFPTVKKTEKDLSLTLPLTDEDYRQFSEDQTHWSPPVVTPQDLYDVLCRIPDEEAAMLGFGPPNPVRALMMGVVPIGSIITRPDYDYGAKAHGRHKKRDGGEQVRAWTQHYRKILQARNNLQDQMQTQALYRGPNLARYSYGYIEAQDPVEVLRYGAGTARKTDAKTLSKRLQAKRQRFSSLDQAWHQLNSRLAEFHSQQAAKVATKNTRSFGGPIVNWEMRVKGFQGRQENSNNKKSRVRKDITSRRGPGIRAVLNADCSLPLDVVGLPRCECANLTKRVAVNELNREDLWHAVLRGPLGRDGANSVTLNDGREFDLQAYRGDRRLLPQSELMYVNRHHRDGDWIIMHRSPALHRGSVMAFRIRVIEGYTVRMHPANFTNLAADCDGDELNAYNVEDPRAEVELQELAVSTRNFSRDGSLWVKVIQHAVLGAHCLTRDDFTLTRGEFMQLGYSALGEWGLERLTELLELHDRSGDAGAPLSGRELFSALLPGDFHYAYQDVVVRQGRLLSGTLNSGKLNGRRGLVLALYLEYTDPQVAADFVFYAYRLFQEVCDRHGFSVSYSDQCLSSQGETRFREWLNPKWHRVNTYVDRLVQRERHTVGLDHGQHVRLEDHIREHADTLFARACVRVRELMLEEGRGENGLLTMREAGVKITDGILGQLAGCFGQVYVMKNRYPQVSAFYERLGLRHHLEAFGFLVHAVSRGLLPRRWWPRLCRPWPTSPPSPSPPASRATASA